MTLFLSVATNCGESELEVEVSVTLGRPGRMYLSNGDPGYPDEPGEVEVLGAWICRGWDDEKKTHRQRRKIELPGRLHAVVEEQAFEEAAQEEEDARSARAEYMREAMLERRFNP